MGSRSRAARSRKRFRQEPSSRRRFLRDLKLSTLDLKTFRVENKPSNEKIRTIIEAANEEKARLEEKAEEGIDQSPSAG